MKKILTSIKEHIIAWFIGITLVLYPLTALAAYAKSPGTPIVKELDGTDTRTGEYKIVGTMEIPQTKLDNFWTDVKKALTPAPKPNKVAAMTPEQRQIQTLQGEILARQMMIDRLKAEK